MCSYLVKKLIFPLFFIFYQMSLSVPLPAKSMRTYIIPPRQAGKLRKSKIIFFLVIIRAILTSLCRYLTSTQLGNLPKMGLDSIRLCMELRSADTKERYRQLVLEGTLPSPNLNVNGVEVFLLWKRGGWV